MSAQIREIGVDQLPDYAAIPSVYQVASVFRVEPIDGGPGGLALVEERVPPYTKSYDTVLEGDRGPIDWPEDFDISNWGIFLAVDGGRPVGGATVAIDTPDVDMLEGRTDLAVLWDLRVHADSRRCGIGSRLFGHAADWARGRGCRQLKIETQNVNVPACRFYARQGCELRAIDRCAYADCPPVAHEAMLIWQLDLR